MNKNQALTTGALLALFVAGGAGAASTATPSLHGIYETLSSKTFVDLTHAFGPTTPHWKGFGEEKVVELYTIKKDGFLVQQFTHVGQWGTHIDTPAHFHEGLRTADQIDPKEMLLPLVILDVHEKVAKNPDYVIALSDVHDWETRHGRIPANAFVAMRTDWSKRWPNDAARQNRDAAGVAHYQRWSKEVLKLLTRIARSRLPGTRPPTPIRRGHTKDDYSLESYVLGSIITRSKCWRTSIGYPIGALVMVSWPKPGRHRLPARVIAILP